MTAKVVPTWDYAVVPSHGTLRFVQDARGLRALGERLTNEREAIAAFYLKIDDAPPLHRKNAGMIVGFEFSIAA